MFYEIKMLGYRQCYVFGSGSIFSQRYGSGSIYHQAKIVRKTLIPIFVGLLYDFLSLTNDVNVPLKSKKQKNWLPTLIYFLKKRLHRLKSLNEADFIPNFKLIKTY
jgi:hypothetical protein